MAWEMWYAQGRLKARETKVHNSKAPFSKWLARYGLKEIKKLLIAEKRNEIEEKHYSQSSERSAYTKEEIKISLIWNFKYENRETFTVLLLLLIIIIEHFK